MGNKRSYHIAVVGEKDEERIASSVELQLTGAGGDISGTAFEAAAIEYALAEKCRFVQTLDPKSVEYLPMPMSNYRYRLHKFQNQWHEFVESVPDVLRIMSGEAARELEK